MPMPKLSRDYPKRGEIYVADLNPGFGREIHKKRPVLIISNNTQNKNFPLVIIIPFSTIIPQFLGHDIVLFELQKGLDERSVLIVNQIRAVDKDRLIKKVGKVSPEKLSQTEEALKLVLGITELN